VKPCDKDILRAFRDVEGLAEMASAQAGFDTAEVRQMRRLEVVLRRLAREAGYDVSGLEAGGE